MPGFQKCIECKLSSNVPGSTAVYFCKKCGWNKIMQDTINFKEEQINEREEEIDELKDEIAIFKAKETHAEEFKILSEIDDTVVKLVVGPRKGVYRYNRALLAFHSPMFHSAFYNGFSETANGKMRLEDDSERVVTAFGAWAMDGVIPVESYSWKRTAKNEDGEDEIEYILMDIAELCIFADKIMCPRFGNAVIKVFFKGLENKLMWSDVAEFIFANTISPSNLRYLVLDTIQAEGPFAVGHNKEYRDNWFAALPQGGELIQAIIEAGGFHNRNSDFHPSKKCNQWKYFEEENKKVRAEDFRKGVAV